MTPWPNTDADRVRRPGLIDLSARVFERTKEFVSMSRGKYPFKQSDITRALKAARKAGEVVQIEVDADRRCMRIIPVKAASGGDNVSEDDLRKLL